MFSEIGDYAFSGSGIVEFTLPEGVKAGTGILLEATSLTKITLRGTGETPKAICMGAVKLKEVIIEGNFSRIGDESFYGCSALTEITLPESITEIGDEAFTYCSVLSSFTAEGKLTSIGGSLPLLYTWTPPNRNSFVLFTYSMPLKGAWVHVCTETCTHGIGKRAKMREFISVGARLSTFVFRRYYQPYRMHRCRNTRNSAAQSKVSEVIQRARSVCFVTLLSTKTRHLVDTQ